MPRYLGVNYWQNLIDQRREFYARALLTVPQNLSSASVKSQINHFNEQWTHCQNLGEFQEATTADTWNLNWHLGSDCFEFWKHKLNGPECYYWSRENQTINRAIGEVIPSSNPDSDDSFEFNDVFTPRDLTSDPIEQFEKEHLKDTEFLLKGCLEDVETSDGLKEIHKNIPQLSRLISRLQPRPVKDPLADDGGTQYTETMCFKDQLTLYSEETLQDDHPEIDALSHLEIFQVIPKLDYENEGELEEVLIPPTRTNKEDPVETILDIQAKVAEVIKLEKEDHLRLKTQDSMDIVQGSKLELDLEKPDMVASARLKADFLTINKSPESKDANLVDSALLESPLLPPSYSLEAQLVHFPGIVELLKNLQPFSVELNSSILFLRQFEKETLLVKVWQQEKFFDEILSLRIQEPEVSPPTPTQCVSVWRLREELTLVEESGLGALELQLSWDPWANCQEHTRSADHPEPFNTEGACLAVPGSMDVETFSKFNKDQLNVSDGKETQMVNEGLQSKQPKKAPDGKQETLKLTKSNPILDKPFEKKKDTDTKTRLGRPASVTTDDALADFSPLDEFMMLRSSKPKAPDFPPVRHQLQKNTGVEDQVECQKTVLEQPVAASIRKLDVQLTDKYREVMAALHVFGNPYLDLLVKAGQVPESASLSNLKVETARFLLKQNEKQRENQSKEKSCEVYKSLVVMYAVVGATDLLIHCCLESAISHLAAVHDKYHTTLGTCLDDIRKQLFQFKVAFDQAKVLHPKVATLCRNVQGVVSDGTTDTDKRVLIVTRNLSSLTSCIEQTLNLTGNISTKVIKQLSEETSSVIKIHKCIILSEDALNDKLEMSLFDLAIEYESGSTSLCEKYRLANINSLSLNCSCSYEGVNKRNKTSMVLANPEIKVTVICAQTVVQHKHLLQLLESRYNIAIIERRQDEESQVPIADIILDERHCIVLHDVCKLTEDYQVEHLTRKLASLGLQYTHCWLVFHSTSSPAKSYILSNNIVGNLSKVEAALANLNRNQDRFHIFYKVLMAYTVDQLAAVVRHCCDTGVETSTVWSGQDWTREWISAEASQEELFLTSIPCITSFSAKFLLCKCSLGMILSYSLLELVDKFPQLPEKVLLMFYKTVNCDTGLHLRSTESNTVSQEMYVDTSHLDGDTFNRERDKSEKHHQTHWNRQDRDESAYFDADLSGPVQAKLGSKKNIGAKIPSTTFCPQSFRNENFTQLETLDENDFSQDLEDSGRAEEYQCMKPNQYVLAELEGMARKDGKLEEFTDFPSFDIIGTSLQNDIEGENKYNFDEWTDISDINLHIPQRRNVPISQTYNTVTNNVPISREYNTVTNKNGTRKRQSFSSLLHDKIIPRNQILKFKENNSNQGAMTPSAHYSRRNFPGKSNTESNVPERVNYQYLSGQSRDRYPPVQSEGDCSRNPQSHSKQRKPVLSEHFQNMLPRSTPRRPLSDHFQSRLLQPPVHRVSIGLAQPLRRRSQPQDLHRETQVVPNVCRWPGEESPPMDLETSPDIGYHYNLKDGITAQIPDDHYMYKRVQNPDFLYLGGYQYDTPNKRKKLSYQPLPGCSAGQTVLTFK